MNRTYLYLKINRIVKSRRIKNMAIFILHLLRRRYIAIFFDPVLACNLSCRMCYFSDPEKRKSLGGRFTPDELRLIAVAFFHRALKLQIGCGAEPSLFRHNNEIIRLAKEKKVPYISMTTNGNLFSENDWYQLVEAGLNEVTLSLHGVLKETYEYFMVNGSYTAFVNALRILTAIRRKYPDFTVRINYTVNKNNLNELAMFFHVFHGFHFDIIQIRPINEIGKSDYTDFSWDDIRAKYSTIIEPFKAECRNRNITCIVPAQNDLIKEVNSASSVVEQTYCYISPRYVWRNNFDIKNDTFESYSKTNRIAQAYFKKIFGKTQSSSRKSSLNYDIT